ncbi:hypothetical protein Geob_2545 [Geotalea daltonii FRC-32]|uniref:Uncharacterized protein n=1 Tax=Geotalea daltonii (strain DSM 22248 / JCM 15807 / FRC-32) TaxID=316067 RepID=B9M0P3_GEODF|nr:hypothetical protein [Geotalea daltonii]ACM20896.1 hypothetical protein Geob_2545 [Geotalea daltonii FRC-32]
MSEGSTFWLENKQAVGTVAALVGDQKLVIYRDRYYIVINGAAVVKGGKPLRYSRSSLPSLWKKALRGDIPAVQVPPVPESDIPARTAVFRKALVRKEKELSIMPESKPSASAPELSPVHPKQRPLKKSTRQPGVKAAIQSVVAAECPYCSQKHEIPVEKGRSGKPFFQSCTKCASDFAVRFVQVTLFQAQVAGFK